MENFIEHKINSVVEINGKQYKVVSSENANQTACFGCALYNENIVKRCKICADYKCSKYDRFDKTDIIYELV